MITNKILPAHILRLYVWAVLDQETSMETIPVTMSNGATAQLIPVLPIEDEPKVANSGKAYAIYGYAENDSRNLEQVREGVFSLRIIAPTFSQLGDISNAVARAFESSDVATEAVNNFSTDYTNSALVGIRFTHTKVTYVEGGEAGETEGGPMDGVVNIAYRYVNSLPIPVPNTARGGLWS